MKEHLMKKNKSRRLFFGFFSIVNQQLKNSVQFWHALWKYESIKQLFN